MNGEEAQQQFPAAGNDGAVTRYRVMSGAQDKALSYLKSALLILVLGMLNCNHRNVAGGPLQFVVQAPCLQPCSARPCSLPPPSPTLCPASFQPHPCCLPPLFSAPSLLLALPQPCPCSLPTLSHAPDSRLLAALSSLLHATSIAQPQFCSLRPLSPALAPRFLSGVASMRRLSAWLHSSTASWALVIA